MRDTQSTEAATSPKGLKRWIGVVLGLVLVIMMVQYFRAHPDLFEALDHLEPVHLTLALILDIGVVLCFVLRNFVVVKEFAQRKPRYFQWFELHVIGQAINVVMMKVGDAYRAHEAKKHFGLAYANYASVFILTSWVDMVVIFVMAAGLRALSGFEQTDQLMLLIGLALAWLLVAPLGTLFLRFITRTRLSPRAIREPVNTLLDGFWGASKNFGLMVRLLGVVLISFSVNTGLYMVLFWGLGAEVAPFQAALLVAAYKLSQLLAVTPGNIGVREWSLGGMCTLLGYDPGLGLIFSMVLRAIHFLALACCLLAAGGPKVILRAVAIGKRAG